MTDLLDTTVVADEERTDVAAADAYRDLLRRLSHQSVVRHFDAYADIPWDDPSYAIDPADPRWELADDDPLGATAWYRSQPPEVRARIGLHQIAAKMKIGLQFESVLKRGLLEYAARLPDGAPEFRYAYHEVIEEAQHSLMFQEFVNRTGLRVPGLPWPLELGARRVVKMGRRFPSLFFVFVLGGEDPIDHVQRTMLRSGREIPPVLERIMRIHVTEEARHLSFARHYLKRHVPRLNPLQRVVLALQAPLTLSTMAAQMLRPPRWLAREYGIPRAVLREAYDPRRNPAARRATLDSLRKVRSLCVELRIVTPASRPLWRALGIWDDAR